MVICVWVALDPSAIEDAPIPPAMVSMPFKLLLFVLIDGWNLVLTGLAASFK